MTKKTIIKYVYFTILLLLPYAIEFFPSKGEIPYPLFLELPWVLYKFSLIDAGLGATVIYSIFHMSINFTMAFLLHKIHKRKSIAGSAILIVIAYIIIIFIASASGMGDGMLVFFVPLWGVIPFCPIYFFGILIYDRYINKEHEFKDGNTSK